VLVPKVMEKSVGLHPMLVIIALLVGATLNGLIGALIAVPIAGAAQVIARSLLIDPAIQSHGPHMEGGLVVFEQEGGADNGAGGERKGILTP
jgi:predicted PurR-regulated permease PerM